MKLKLSLAIFIPLLILVSCSSGSSLSSTETDLLIINLQTTPALTHWLPQVAACAEPIPDIGIYTQILPPKDLNLEEGNLILRLGERRESDTYITVVGMEKISVVAGKDIPLSSISIESLQDIYAGKTKNWDSVPEVVDAGIEINQPIQLISYPEGSELRELFLNDVLEINEVTRNVEFFSTLDYLQSWLIENSYGIGYLLESQVPDEIQTLTLSNSIPESAQVYVLAVTDQEPAGGLRQLLLCLQNSW
jgi:hypothetical protein